MASGSALTVADKGIGTISNAKKSLLVISMMLKKSTYIDGMGAVITAHL